MKFSAGKLLKSKLVNSFGIYTIFSVMDKLMPFLFLPIIARQISADDMGSYILYQSIYAIVFFLLSLNTDSAILLNYYKLSKFRFSVYLSNGLMLFLGWYVFFAAVLFLSAGSVAGWLGFPSFWMQVLLLVVVFQYVQTLKLNMYQVMKKPSSYGIFRISNTLLTYGLALYFIFVLHLSWEGFVLAQLITSFLFAIVAVVLMYREKLFRFKVYTPFLKDNLRVGLPLTLHNLNAWLGNFASRFIINALIGKAATGSYGVGATFGMIMTVLQESFNRAFVPYLFENLKNISEVVKLRLVRFTYLYYAAILVFATVIGTVGYAGVGWLFGAEYVATRHLIFPIVFANAINGMYKMHINYLFYQKRTLRIAQVTFFGGIVNIALCYLFVSYYGITGAAYALLVSQTVSYVVAFYLGNKAINMPWFRAGNNFNLVGLLKRG